MGKLLVKVVYKNPSISQPDLDIPKFAPKANDINDTTDQVTDVDLDADVNVANSAAKVISLHYVFHFEYKDPYVLKNLGGGSKSSISDYNLSSFASLPRRTTHTRATQADRSIRDFVRPITPPFYPRQSSMRPPSRVFYSGPISHLQRDRREGSAMPASARNVGDAEFDRLRSPSEFSLELDSGERGSPSADDSHSIPQVLYFFTATHSLFVYTFEAPRMRSKISKGNKWIWK